MLQTTLIAKVPWDLTSNMAKETLAVNIKLSTHNQVNVSVAINGSVVYSGLVAKPVDITVDHDFVLFSPQQITITKDQGDLVIDHISINNIDLRNLVWHKSYFTKENIAEPVYGETWMNEAGRWTLPFRSPFWKFMMDWVNGEIR